MYSLLLYVSRDFQRDGILHGLACQAGLDHRPIDSVTPAVDQLAFVLVQCGQGGDHIDQGQLLQGLGPARRWRLVPDGKGHLLVH